MQSPDGMHSDFGYFDLNTAILADPVQIPTPVNAIGYSRTQKVFWGVFTNVNPDRLVRIDSAGNTFDAGQILPNLRTNTGTVGRYQGREALFLHTIEPANQLVIVDVDVSDGQVGAVLAQIPLSRATPGLSYLRVGDWDFDPGDGLLYSLEMEGDSIRRLITVDPASGAVVDVKDLSGRVPDGHNYGGVYVEDVSGTIYMANNDVNDLLAKGGTNGFSQTFGYYPAQDVVIAYTPATKSKALLINDGADCLVATDFGDAPDSYRTLNPNDGPGHIFSEVGDPDATGSVDPDRRLRIGALIDPDLDGIPTPGADGDDLNLPINDEDGVSAGTLLDRAAAALTVPITNSTGAPATLAGWIDFDGSGSFEPGERALTAVPAASGDAILTWQPAPGTANETYLRLRLYPGTVADPAATGATFINGGEIEDHKVGLTALAETGTDVGSLVKAGVLLVVCGGMGLAMGSRRSGL